MDNVTTPFVVRRMAGAIGAEIGGIKLRPDLPDAVIAELRQLWLEHLVLFFRNQELTPQELAAVARRFGEVVHYPFLKGLDEAPEVIRVAKLEADVLRHGRRSISHLSPTGRARNTSIRPLWLRPTRPFQCQ
jgi:alpha-ketoglutarate-dependent taurine dioxygenase